MPDDADAPHPGQWRSGATFREFLDDVNEFWQTPEGQRLQNARHAEEADLQAWLADLESPVFKAREAAHKDIARAGELIEPALRRALAATANAEVRRRLTAVLDSLSHLEARPDHLRSRGHGGGQARLNDTSTVPAGRPFSTMTCSPESYDQLPPGSAVPFTDTQTGARTA